MSQSIMSIVGKKGDSRVAFHDEAASCSSSNNPLILNNP
jgi:hypothetical protein